MKKVILMAVALLSTVATFAQHQVGSISVKPEVGMTIANYRGDDADGLNAKVGAIAGAELEYQVSPMFSLTGGLLYSMEGAKIEDADASIRTEYINIPLLANVYVAKGFALKAGIQPAFMTSAKAHASAGGVSGDVSIKKGMESFDFAIPVGMSYEFNDFVIDARYNFSVTKAFKDSFDFNGETYSSEGSNDAYNSVFQITLGYKFDL